MEELLIDEKGSFTKLDGMLMGTNCGSESAEGMIMVEVAKVVVVAVVVVVVEAVEVAVVVEVVGEVVGVVEVVLIVIVVVEVVVVEVVGVVEVVVGITEEFDITDNPVMVGTSSTGRVVVLVIIFVDIPLEELLFEIDILLVDKIEMLDIELSAAVVVVEVVVVVEA